MQTNFQCIVPCGGNGSRMAASTSKCLLKAGNKTLLEHIIEFWAARQVTEFIFIVGGEYANQVTKHVKKICHDPTIINRRNRNNLLSAIQLAEPYIKSRFVLALGDCLNFGEFVNEYEIPGVGVCIAEEYELKKSYLVQIDSFGVTKLVEKPKSKVPGLCGMGTMFFDRQLFDYIERLRLPRQATSVDLTGALQLAIGEGETVNPVFFKGSYINITYPQDLATADKLARIHNNSNIAKEVLCC